MTTNITNDIETRKSFVFFLEWADCLMELTAEERLNVYDALMQYVRTGEAPTLSGASNIAFKFIMHDFQRADAQYQRRLRQRSEAGRKHRGNQYTQNTEETTTAPSAEPAPEPQTEEVQTADLQYSQPAEPAPPANPAPTHVDEKREAFKSQLKPYLEQYGRETLNAFFGYWTEPTPDGKRLRYELQPTWSTAHRLRAWKEREQAHAATATHTKDNHAATAQERERLYQQMLDRQMQELDRKKHEQKSKAITFQEYMRQRNSSAPSLLGS